MGRLGSVFRGLDDYPGRSKSKESKCDVEMVVQTSKHLLEAHFQPWTGRVGASFNLTTLDLLLAIGLSTSILLLNLKSYLNLNRGQAKVVVD